MSQIISSEQTKTLMQQGAQLIDVRTPSEFKQGSAPGAKNVPVCFLKAEMRRFDLKKPVIVYCRTGGRSAVAERLLQGFGFQQVHNAGVMYNYLNDCKV